MHTITYLLFILSFLFYGFNTSAQADSITDLSLDDAIQQAIENNYSVRISRGELRIAENNNTLGNAGILPTVSIGTNQINRYDDTQNQFRLETRDKRQTHSLSPYLNIQMVLFNGFRLKLSKENLEQMYAMQEVSLESSIETIISEVTNAYYAAVLENEKLDVSRELMQLSRDRYRYVNNRRELGLAVSYDVLQVKNAFLQDSSAYLSQKMQRDIAYRNLSAGIADTSFSLYSLADSLQSPDAVYDLQTLEESMLANNTSLRTMHHSQKVLRNSIELARSSWYPSLALNAGADYSKSYIKMNDADFLDTYSYDYYANLSLSYTIFNGGNRSRQIQNAKIETQNGILQIEELELTLRNNLRTLYQMYEVRKQLLRVAEENLEAAKLNLEISTQKYKTGSINSFNYRDVQMIYMNAAYSHLQAKYNLIATHIDLLRITGSLLTNVSE